MLTSRRPDTLHLYDFFSYWRTTVGNFTTLPQYLKMSGYETLSIGKIFHPGISSNYSDDYPYSWSEKPYHSASESFMNKANCMNVASGTLEKNVICPVEVKYQPFGTLPDIDSVIQAKKFLNTHKESQQPYFLAVGFHKPHIPLRFPSNYLQYHKLKKFTQPSFQYRPPTMPTVAFNPYCDIRSRTDAKHQNITFPFGPIPFDFGVELRQAYYAAVTYIDDLVGEILSVIDLNETIVILTSDHGWSLGEHTAWAKYSNFEVAVRVPLIMHLPFLSSNHKTQKVINEIVELVDLFPTIVDIAMVPSIEKCSINHVQNTCVEGKSLLPFILKTDPSTVQSVAFSQFPRPADYPMMNSDSPKLNEIEIMGYSMRTQQFRYTIWIKFLHKKFERSNFYLLW